MKIKIYIMCFLILTLSSCIINNNTNKKINTNKYTNIQKKPFSNHKSKNKTNSGIIILDTKSGSNNGTNSIIKTNKEKETLKKIIKDKTISNSGKVNNSNTDKSIDELLKDFDEELDIEELLGED